MKNVKKVLAVALCAAAVVTTVIPLNVKADEYCSYKGATEITRYCSAGVKYVVFENKYLCVTSSGSDYYKYTTLTQMMGGC